MGAVILVLGLPALCWLAYKKPLLATVVLSFVAFSGDSIGIVTFIERNGGRDFALSTRLPILIAAASAWRHLFQQVSRGRLPRHLLWLANIAILGASWSALGTLLKGAPISTAFVIAINTGLLFAVVGLAYAAEAGTRRLLGIAVALHILLAISVSVGHNTFLGEFGGWHYYELRDFTMFSRNAVEDLGGLDRSQRAQGHFNNTHGFAVYSAFGIAMGIILLTTIINRKGISTWLAGTFMCLIGISGLFLTLGRSELLGVVMGVVWAAYLLIFDKTAVSSRAIIRVAFFIMLLSIMYMTLWTSGGQLLSAAFVGDVGESTAVRMEVLSLGERAIMKYPILGVPNDFVWLGSNSNIYPHSLPMYYSALYGLPVGVAAIILLSALFWGPFYARRFLKREYRKEIARAGMFAGIILSVTNSNNCPAPILLWWAWALVVFPYEDMRRHLSTQKTTRAILI